MSESPKNQLLTYTDLRKTFSSTSAASSATGITSADLVTSFQETAISNNNIPMSGMPQDSIKNSNSENNDNNQSLIPDQQYYYHNASTDSQSQAATEYTQATRMEDGTKAVQEMHHALLYLMSHPEEYHRAISQQNQPHTVHIDVSTSLDDWQRRLYNESESVQETPPPKVPLPYIVFAPDAEVVLPQAHTASQLFGIETITGVELEAAAGIPAISQLFLRWLALMPQGDHMNIVDPPGLTMMRIAGGRFRVTAAHRVVWTWYNDLFSEEEEDSLPVQFEDLVSMTIMDVFETDEYGRLLSYCPTFDNRAVHKTNISKERLSKRSYKLRKQAEYVAQSPAAKTVNKAASFLGRMSFSAGKKTFDYIKKEVERQSEKSPPPPHNLRRIPKPKSFASELSSPTQASESPPEISASSTMREAMSANQSTQKRSEHYISDDDDDTQDVSER